MLDLIIDARPASLGNGFTVRRILPYRLRRMLGPFIFMDHGGPVSIDPAPISNLDVLPHPHIGLSTVSYLFDGQVTHRDSLGVQQVIRPGEVNWMTARSGHCPLRTLRRPGRAGRWYVGNDPNLGCPARSYRRKRANLRQLPAG
ncbi:pirin family protein [Spirosoma fluminis]